MVPYNSGISEMEINIHATSPWVHLDLRIKYDVGICHVDLYTT
jgi:hypothetical protein